MPIRIVALLFILLSLTAADWTIPAQPYIRYKMNDNAGTTAVDNTGSAGAGGDGIANVNTDTFDATGKVGGALDFYGGGTDKQVVLASDPLTSANSSLCGWFYPHTAGESNFGHVYRNDGNHRAGINGTAWDFSCDAVNLVSAGAGSVSLNAWQYVCWIRSGTTGQVYKNGVASGSSGPTGTCAAGAASAIGSRLSSLTYSFDGLMDNVLIFQRAISAGEVEALYRVESHGDQFGYGRWFAKDGVPAIMMGMFYVDYTSCPSAAETKRAAAIADMGTLDMDVLITPLDAGCTATKTAATNAGIDLIPEWNDTYTDVDAALGPFEAFSVFDDIDAGCDASCTYSCGDIQTEVATKKAGLSGTPMAFASAGNIAGTTSAYFSCDLDALEFQSYPIGDENYTNHDYDSKMYYWQHMIGYTGPFIANVQSMHWYRAALTPQHYRWPIAEEITRMSYWALDAGAAGIIYYTYYDSIAAGGGVEANDLSLVSLDSQHDALGVVVAEVRRCEKFWLRRLQTE